MVFVLIFLQSKGVFEQLKIDILIFGICALPMFIFALGGDYFANMVNPINRRSCAYRCECSVSCSREAV